MLTPEEFAALPGIPIRSPWDERSASVPDLGCNFTPRALGMGACDFTPRALAGMHGQLKVVGAGGPGTPLVKVIQIPDGEAGTAETIKVMKRLAIEGSQNPALIQWAQAIVRGIGSKDYAAELRAIHDFVQSKVKYRLDPTALEWIQAPEYTLLVRGEGDCDDQATLSVALAMALGHPAGLVTVKADKSRPGEYSHVYAVLGARQGNDIKWFGSDTTQAGVPLGWEPPPERVFGKRIWPVGG